MLSRLHIFCAILATLLGALHIGFGLYIYADLTLDALWFYGAGIAMMSVAIGNLNMPPKQNKYRNITAIQNAVMLIYFCIAWTVLPAPQVAIGGMLFFMLTILSFYINLQSQTSNSN